jgi:fibro-slime domain-containing protein
VAPVTGVLRNFYFTSEVRYLFRYVGGETLAFYGDDDVWVFINGNLVLDLGAPHERLQGTVTLTSTGADWVIQSQNIVSGVWANIATGSVTGLGLELDNTYEIAVFHADRHPRESNYQLTLSGFSTTRSVCEPECGNGIVTAGEECDDGPANQNDLYGGCTLDCTYGPFCGDGIVNGPEECDLGRENGPSYGGDSCTTACTKSHYCGDGIIDSAFGEECDEGEVNGSGICTEACKMILF